MHNPLPTSQNASECSGFIVSPISPAFNGNTENYSSLSSNHSMLFPPIQSPDVKLSGFMRYVLKDLSALKQITAFFQESSHVF